MYVQNSHIINVIISLIANLILQQNQINLERNYVLTVLCKIENFPVRLKKNVFPKIILFNLLDRNSGDFFFFVYIFI